MRLDEFTTIFQSHAPCAPIAIARVTGKDPKEVERACRVAHWSEQGMNEDMMLTALNTLGFTCDRRPDLMYGHQKIPRSLGQVVNDLPPRGHFIINIEHHTMAYVDGNLMDDVNSSMVSKVTDVIEVHQ